MTARTTDTRERLLEAAKREFLQYGFRQASLRRIADTVGIAAPSVYSHFDSKEALFAALAEPVIQGVSAIFHAADAEKQTLARQRETGRLLEKTKPMQATLDFVFSHRDAVYLLLFCAEGTPYADLLDRVARTETEATLQASLLAGRPPFTGMQRQTVFLLTRHQYHAYVEALRQGWDREQTWHYWQTVRAFYDAGWQQLLGWTDDGKEGKKK